MERTSQFDGNSQRRGTCCCTCEFRPPEEIFGRLPKRSVIVTCPNCRSAQHTRITHQNTMLVHLCALLLLPCGLCCLPYCISICKKSRHNCRVCTAYIGVSPICEKKPCR